MNANNQSVSLLSIVIAGLRVLAGLPVGNAPLTHQITTNKMSQLTVKELVELADTLHCLDGVSHSTMRKMGKGKLVSRIISEIGG